MNKQQKEVELAKIKAEKQIVNRLKRQYNSATDQINKKVEILQKQIDNLTERLKDASPEEANIIKSQMMAKVYQKSYQESLKSQIDSVVDKMNTVKNREVDSYLNECYKTGFAGTMYDLKGQGIPIIAPIEQKSVERALKLDSKVSQRLYSGYVNRMKKQIQSEISRGIATARPYTEIARNLNNVTNAGLNNTMRIVRTEGHRIQSHAVIDAQKAAKDNGADIVKQWDATLDGATRDTHRQLDGQIREIDEDFEVNGNTVSAPGLFGDPAEDCNCRCCLLQRAKWALDESELTQLQNRADYFGLDKTENFNEYKEKYLNIVKEKDSDIIKTAVAKEEIEVHPVGKINRDIYKCITDDIVTDEVIITDNQIQHILDRHPEAYEKSITSMGEALKNPDYIFSDKHENTGLVVKRVKYEGEYIQMVLRIATTNDNNSYKNSIISCWNISERRLQNYLRNKEILYKKE